MSSSSTVTPPTTVKDPPVCSFFVKGKCRYGERCRKRHVPAQVVDSSAQGATPTEFRTQNRTSVTTNVSSEVPEPSQNRPYATQSTKPCFKWARGSCPRGDQCKYRHDPDARKVPVIQKDQKGQETTGGEEPQSPRACTASTAIGPKKEQGVSFAQIDGITQDQSNRATPIETIRRQTKRRQSKKEAHEEREKRARKEAEERARREAEERARREAEERARREAEERARREAEERARREAEERARREAEERARREAEEKARREAEEKARLEAERTRRIEAQRRKAEERAKKRREAEEKRRIEEEARREEKDRLDAAKTIQHLVLGSTIVKFSAGVAIERIITGFYSCRVRITNLPLNAKPHEVKNLLLDQGMEEDMFQLVNLRTWNGKKEANFIVEEEWGRAIASGIDGIDFRGESLVVEATDSGTLEGMNSNNSALLSITWRIPLRRFALRYFSPDEATRRLHSMNVINGQKIKVEQNRLPYSTVPDPCSLLVSGLPSDMSGEEVKDLFDAYSIRQISSLSYNENLVEGLLQNHIRTLMFDGSVDFDPSQLNASQGNRSLRARFKSWEDAKKVHDQLANKKFAFIGNSTFRLWLPDPYQITIPMQQYTAQKKQWDSFVDDTKNRKESTLHVRMFPDKVVLRVGGDDIKAVGMLKVRVESLVAGEVLQDLWHVLFGSGAGQRFLASLYTETGAYVRYDWRVKLLKAYGDRDAVGQAREKIKEELTRLSSLEYTEHLTRSSIRFFAQRGVAALKEAFGEESVVLDISSDPVRITIRGGEDARHLLRKLLDESLLNTATDFSSTSESTCPVCLMDVSNPVKLGCGHQYCTACIRHFFTADIKNFPLLCGGDDGMCMTPIALPMIEKFLTPSQLNALLETAFTTHIEKSPQSYRYCKTPDCKQIYKCDTSGFTKTARQCPSCLASVCMRCHEDGHDGMTCEERRIQSDPAEQERLNDAWAREAGVKRCPECRVWIQKTEGCNHMTCKCGAHICWVCMRIFTAQTIYNHMHEAHGGIYEMNQPMVQDEDVDVPAQLEAFRAFENRGQREQARRLEQARLERNAAEERNRRVQERMNLYQNYLVGQRERDLQAQRERELQAQRERELQAQRERELQAQRERERRNNSRCVVM
ncbi:hypothetical protein VNI00_008727 [Paramarasmius palmivorus]|uniref:RBR-type E3 ubiquitin transferase n=1 Tax=Paramarasmius palmivorus TaxID=297713 RepID=A0AAW0CXX4_9AGAR